MLEFNDTSIAFQSKSNKDLNRAYWLFKIINYPSIVKIGKVITPIALRIKLPIQKLIKTTIFKQFCGGETIEECHATTNSLFKNNIGTILDYSVEGKTSNADFDKTTNEIIATIHKAYNNPAIPYAVFKTTGIARFQILEKANSSDSELSFSEKNELNEIIGRIDKICKAAFENKVPVFIDAEESWIQDVIDRITTAMMTKYNKEKAIVFNTIQMYRHDRLSFLQDAIEEAKRNNYHYGIKLVRGAYMEKERERAELKNYPSPIQENKENTDKDYNLALHLILENIQYCALCAGTHNEYSSSYLSDLLLQHGISKSDKRIYFAQLLGMSDHISYILSHNGFNVAKYVPYGPISEVLPYLLRRADENTSVAGQTGRELNLLITEKKRRKQNA
jgi:proline dehydrogenase